MAGKGDKVLGISDVFQRCPHCRKMITEKIKMATPVSDTPEQLITCSECKKQILVHCQSDPYNGAPWVCFIKYPLVIVP